MPRKIWVTTTSHGSGRPTVEENTEAVRSLLEAACALRPDIVCLPETFASSGVAYEQAEYVAWNERAQDALREGRSPAPQHPPYLNRQQYLA